MSPSIVPLPSTSQSQPSTESLRRLPSQVPFVPSTVSAFSAFLAGNDGRSSAVDSTASSGVTLHTKAASVPPTSIKPDLTTHLEFITIVPEPIVRMETPTPVPARTLLAAKVKTAASGKLLVTSTPPRMYSTSPVSLPSPVSVQVPLPSAVKHDQSSQAPSALSSPANVGENGKPTEGSTSPRKQGFLGTSTSLPALFSTKAEQPPTAALGSQAGVAPAQPSAAAEPVIALKSEPKLTRTTSPSPLAVTSLSAAKNDYITTSVTQKKVFFLPTSVFQSDPKVVFPTIAVMNSSAKVPASGAKSEDVLLEGDTATASQELSQAATSSASQAQEKMPREASMEQDALHSSQHAAGQPTGPSTAKSLSVPASKVTSEPAASNKAADDDAETILTRDLSPLPPTTKSPSRPAGAMAARTAVSDPQLGATGTEAEEDAKEEARPHWVTHRAPTGSEPALTPLGSEPRVLLSDSRQRRVLQQDGAVLSGITVVSDEACGSGNYTVQMSLRPVAEASPELQGSALPQDTFLASLAMRSSSSQPVLRVRSCCVTPSSSPGGPGAVCCLLPRLLPECRHIQLLQSSEPRAASFTIQLFQMLNHSVAYLHCELSVCLHGKPGCEQGCFDSVEPLPQPGDRNSPGQLRNLISFGPVLRLKDRFLYKAVQEADPQLGSLTIFSKEDFEEDWVKVASGGFGCVYQVKHRRWRTVYAVKCSPYLLQDSSTERNSVNCLMEEATKMEKIKFQHIVTIYGVCNSPLGIVMEYMARGSLEKILPTHKMSWQLKFRVIHEMGLAMNFLHSMTPPLLHLDLKPGNILLDGNMHVKISDFGLSKWMEQSSRMQYIESSALRGTLSYIPPEMFLQNTKPPGIKYDVYSFGIVIWEVLMQKKPYAGANMMAIIVKVAAGKRPCLEPTRDDWPGECQQMVDLMKRCWDQDPKQRPSFTDIPVETDMLLSLIQSLVVDPENERLVRKMSHKPAISGSQQCDKEEFIFSQAPRSAETGKEEVRVPPSWGETESPEDVLSEEICRVHDNGLTLLHVMVIQGDVDKVKFLLSCKADVNSQAVCGYTPLIMAVQRRSPEICSVLIENDADINMPDEDGWTPLHFAAQNGDDRIVRLLLDHQAQVNAQEHDGWTPLHLASQNNFENVARVLLSRQADSNTQEVDGKTALHVAACFGHVSLVKLLASQGADLEKKQKNHRTPLHVAVERGKFRVVHYLLKNGASVNSLDQNHYSALHLAVARGKYLICEKLIKYGANVELRTDKGWTPLHLASFKGHIEIIHLLKDSHAKLNARGSMDWTPLHLATRYSEEPVVCELLRCGADPNIAEKSEWAPLHFAVQRGSFLTVINLLECRADVNAKNKVGWTPLHLAVLKGNMAIIKTLIKAGALLDVEDITGCTALQLAIRHQKENIITLLQGKDSVMNKSGNRTLVNDAKISRPRFVPRRTDL
ncbi:ankyrin repeat and protein kinase domain-containing protein 1 [Mergus octosetaceus]